MHTLVKYIYREQKKMEEYNHMIKKIKKNKKKSNIIEKNYSRKNKNQKSKERKELKYIFSFKNYNRKLSLPLSLSPFFSSSLN
jgi:hypothetical protein